jgi:hypothetical protein
MTLGLLGKALEAVLGPGREDRGFTKQAKRTQREFLMLKASLCVLCAFVVNIS